ncbi:MAG TPA: hypothetical protein VKC34_12035 [Blastocatellia bacterium]|nr:hypothetical protein [Blastocatellia bacterium]
MAGSNLSQLDSKLDWLKKRTARTIDLALEKVVAHHENPQQYPLPGDAGSLERSLHRMFQSLPAGSRKRVIDKANETLKAGSTQRNYVYGDLAGVNLRSASPIVQQVRSLPVASNRKFTQAEMDEISGRHKRLPFLKPKRKSRAAPAQAVEAAELAFVVESLTCDRPSDIRKDEVNLAGFAVDNLGGGLELAPLFLGKFKKGETLGLGGNGRLFNFKLTEGEFPKTFIGGVFLVEKDLLRNSEFVAGLALFCIAAALALSAITVTMLVVGLAGGPVSIPLLTGLLIAEILFLGATSIIVKLADDVSTTASDALTLEAPVAPGTEFDRTFNFEITAGGGKYTAAVKWVTA